MNIKKKIEHFRDKSDLYGFGAFVFLLAFLFVIGWSLGSGWSLLMCAVCSGLPLSMMIICILMSDRNTDAVRRLTMLYNKNKVIGNLNRKQFFEKVDNCKNPYVINSLTDIINYLMNED